MRALIALALITGARAGELLALRWEQVTDDALTFLETKNGKPRRIPLSAGRAGRPGVAAARSIAHVFTNSVDARSLHRQRRRARLQAGGRAGRHHHGRRHPAHAAAYGAQPDGRGRHRRLHRHGGVGAQLDADARALHAPDRSAEDRRPGDVHPVAVRHNRGHNRRRRRPTTRPNCGIC